MDSTAFTTFTLETEAGPIQVGHTADDDQLWLPIPQVRAAASGLGLELGDEQSSQALLIFDLGLSGVEDVARACIEQIKAGRN